MVCELREQEFITEAFRMIATSQKNEQPTDFRVGMDNDAVAQGEVRYD
jgi:hypothetical protein